MKMIPGSGSIADYTSYISNCTTRQRNYKIPVTSLADVQLYIDFGEDAPGDTGIFELIHTCGPLSGTVEILTPAAYVTGQDADLNYYGVFKGFNEDTSATCFVIAITIGDTVYFSEEYCFGICENLTLVKSCYGNLDPLISFDREGIYFGQSQGGTQGDASLVYDHQFYMRDVEVSLNAIKNEFKSGRTRNFRTESTDIYLFWGEWVPGWYLKHVDAVFKRGEVFIGDQAIKYLLDNTIYENLDDCSQCWRPSVLFRAQQFQSFSCEEDPCTVVVGGGGGGGETCCSPTVTGATVEFLEGNTVCLEFTPCEPTPANGFTILWRVAGSGSGYTTITGVTASPHCFGTGGTEGDQYEGFIYADCGGGITGPQIPWTTGVTPTARITQTVCSGIFSQYELTGLIPGDVITVRASFGGFMPWVAGSFTRADLTFIAPEGTPISQSTNSPCNTDGLGHGFGPLILDTVIIATGTTAIVTTNAVVHNSTAGSSSISVGIIDINGDTVDIWAPGCVGNSSTGDIC